MEEPNPNENLENKENVEEKKAEEAEPNPENAQQEQKPPEPQENQNQNEEIKPPEENKAQNEIKPEVENQNQNQEEVKQPEENKNEIKPEENQIQNEIKQPEAQPQNVIPNVNNNQIQNNQAIAENNRIQEEKQKKIKEENDRIVGVIKDKIKKMNDYYNFCLQYEDVIYKILYNLDELTYEKITNSLDDGFNFVYFFKNSAELYSKFAEEIQNCNKLITFEEKKPKMTDGFLSNVMQSTQNIFYQNLSKFSHGMRQNIIAKGPLSQLSEKKSKIDVIKKTQLKKFSELIDEKKNLEKKYKSYIKLFSSFVPELIPPNPKAPNNPVQPMPELIDSPDFVYIVKDFLDSLNALLSKMIKFTTEAKESMKAINALFVEVYNLIKEAISIYIKESKIFFNQEVTKKFEEVENYFKKYDQNAKENNTFKLTRIFHNEQVKENIYNLLQQYYMLLCNSNTIKKELISDRNAFSTDKYQNVDLFFDWLISVLPTKLEVPVNDLIIKSFEIKRDPGFFSRWKQAGMVFTRQHHLILFDKVNSYKIEDIVKIFETDKITYQRKEDKKKGLLFEVVADVKGKVMNFKGTFLFDALTMENINEISELINNKA